MIRLRYFLEAVVFSFLLALAGVVPRRFLLAVGGLTGAIFGLLDRRHTHIARDNLRRAYADSLDEAEVERIVRACWRHYGRVTLDILAAARLDEAEARKLVHFEGLEHLRAAYARNRGVLLFTGHFGHWELSGLMQGYMGLPLALVARPLDNPRLEKMLSRVRTRSGNRIIHKRNAVRGILKALNDQIGVAIVIDQDAGGDGVFVSFFERPASTTPTLALMALRTGAVVLPSYSIPNSDGTYRVVYEPPVEVEQTGDRQADLLRLTQHCTSVIERWIRDRPELWLWMHRRWKTRPPAG